MQALPFIILVSEVILFMESIFKLCLAVNQIYNLQKKNKQALSLLCIVPQNSPSNIYKKITH